MKLTDYRKIAKQVQDDLSATLAKHGLKMKPFGARIDERYGTVRMTIECADVNHKDESGNTTTPERELYKSQCYLVDLKPEWLDQPFSMGTGKTYMIAGLKPRGNKCVLIKSLGDLKTYIATPEQIRHAFIVKDVLANKSNGKRAVA